METVNVQRLEYLDRLIRTKAGGTPTQLAAKLQISIRSLYYYINFLRNVGAPIKYCRISKRYYYEFDGKLIISFM